jgi:hypothetical protein
MGEIQKKLDFDANTEIVYTEGWKGKDKIQIFSGIQIFKLVEHRRQKSSNEIVTTVHTIPREDLDFLWNLIRKNCELCETYDYKYIVKIIIEEKGLHEKEGLTVDQMINSFNGGKHRSRYLFPFYYFPMKILEAKGYVDYGGRGEIIRLEDNIFVR